MILIPLTILILFHRFQWQIAVALLLFEGWQRVAPICALFHRAGSSRERNLIGIRVSFPKRWQRVAPIYRAGCLLVKETWLGFACLSPRGDNGLPRSLTHWSVSFPLLRRPSLVVIPLWVACWERAFNRLFMISQMRSLGRCRQRVAPVSPLSVLALQGFWFPQLFFSGLTEVEDDTFDGALAIRLIIGRDFSRTNCRTEMANVEKTQQMIPFVTC